MATKTEQPKQRSKLAPQKPEGDSSVPLEKPKKPGYLKPTISSCREVCKHNKNPVASGSAAMKQRLLHSKKSTEKSPPPPQMLKTPISHVMREKAVGPTSPTAKSIIASSRALKTSRSGRAQTLKGKPKIEQTSVTGEEEEEEEVKEPTVSVVETTEATPAQTESETEVSEAGVAEQATPTREEPKISSPTAKEAEEVEEPKPPTDIEETQSEETKVGEAEEATVVEEANVEEPIVKEETAVVVQKREGKKEARQAYNEVIEETASRLVGKRKSKVKALVGAFETVISLQEVEGGQGQAKEEEEGGCGGA
ncbi:hypothetical protein QJS04_geneDACA004036 [Acorus gramineus]|uniref:Calmodulin-binding domain-containing protein n=1 Tax=Acorus gramineus TaxID=55184 RepID=A0AAV9BLX4_ACOGR|nr:hypothetical protein QJS04_geneDACA004036 [Acorus gramineus]